MKTLFLGIRADRLTTEAVLTDDSGHSLSRVLVPNSEARSTRELLSRVYQEAIQDHSGSLTAAVALPGLFTEPLRRAATDTVRSVLPQGSAVLLCDELEALLAGALGGRPGLVARSGHDAAIGRVTDEGLFSRTEEEFDPLGQEGSVLWLGTRTLQLAVRILEGRLPPSPRLEGLLKEHFNSVTLGQIVENLEHQAPDAENIAELGRRTLELSAFPDPEPACRALVIRATRKFSELLEQAVHPEEDLAGVLHDSAAHEVFREEVVRQSPRISWQESHSSPLDGALLLAEAYARLVSDGGSEPEREIGAEVWRAAMKQASRL